jgi:predicted RNase H-like HicB family nuclease
MAVQLSIELETEADGRWIAEIPALPGTLCYGVTREQAIAHVQALALRVLAERLEHSEAPQEALSITFQAA